jgi:membrane protein DedA with SNARE-associated domain
MDPDPIAQFLGTWGYPAYVLLFAATGVGSPVTEDLLLLTGGYLIAAGVFSWPVGLPLSYACVLGTDCMLYSIGRFLRTHSLKRTGWLRRIVRPAQLRIATRWFGRFGDRVVFMARFVPGTRLLVYITAGLRAMPISRFLLIDGSASALYVPLLLWLGVKLGERIGALDRALDYVGDRVLWILLAVAAFAVVRHLWRRRLRRYLDEL